MVLSSHQHEVQLLVGRTHFFLWRSVRGYDSFSCPTPNTASRALWSPIGVFTQPNGNIKVTGSIFSHGSSVYLSRSARRSSTWGALVRS